MNPIPAEKIPEAQQLLQQTNLDAEAAYLTILQFKELARYSNHLRTCATCNGVEKCKTITPSVDSDGRLSFQYATCPKAVQAQINQTAAEIIKRAKVPKIFAKTRAKDFKTTVNNSQVIELAENAIFENQSMYIFGHCGAGKTLIASIIANERAYLNKTSLFVNVPDILEELRPNYQSTSDDTDSPSVKLQRMYNSKCLILDDIGAEKASDWTTEILFKILNHRYNNEAQIIITSNLDITQLANHIKGVNGERIIRRIRETCATIQLK